MAGATAEGSFPSSSLVPMVAYEVVELEVGLRIDDQQAARQVCCLAHCWD
jgi:hypothetical protein